MLLLLSLFLVAAAVNAIPEQYEVVLREGYTLQGGASVLTHGDLCQFRVHQTGILQTLIYNFDRQEYATAWSTAGGTTGAYELSINATDGSLELWRTTDTTPVSTLAYKTVRFADPYYMAGVAPFRLVMTKDCVLELHGEALYEDGETYEIAVWSSSRSYMTWTDVMQAGDILTGYNWMCNEGHNCHNNTNNDTKILDENPPGVPVPIPAANTKNYCAKVPMMLVLQQDCNVVQYVGTSMADAAEVVWTPNIASNATTSCYVYWDNTTRTIGVFAGRFWDTTDRATGHPQRPGRYWNTTPGNWEETQLYDEDGFYQD